MLSREELVTGLEHEFPGMREHTRHSIPMLFEAHSIAIPGTETPGLDIQLFNSTYAAILFSLFDENNDGVLQLEEATAALRFLQPHGHDLGAATTFAFPPDAYTADGIQLGPEWFYGVFQAMS